jgi:hypothetical protein
MREKEFSLSTLGRVAPIVIELESFTTGHWRGFVPEINAGGTPSARTSILVLDDDDGFRRFQSCKR